MADPCCPSACNHCTAMSSARFLTVTLISVVFSLGSSVSPFPSLARVLFFYFPLSPLCLFFPNSQTPLMHSKPWRESSSLLLARVAPACIPCRFPCLHLRPQLCLLRIQIPLLNPALCLVHCLPPVALLQRKARPTLQVCSSASYWHTHACRHCRIIGCDPDLDVACHAVHCTMAGREAC